jgi:hypothetical protein
MATDTLPTLVTPAAMADTLEARAGQLEHEADINEQNLEGARAMIARERARAKELRGAAAMLRQPNGA